MRNTTDSQAMQNAEKIIHRRRLKKISIIVGTLVFALFLYLVLGNPHISYKSHLKSIDKEKALHDCPVIIITDAERDFVDAAHEYCLELAAASPDDNYIYPEVDVLQSMLENAGLSSFAIHGLYATDYGQLVLRYDDTFYRYELSFSDKEMTVTKVISELWGSGDIGILQREYSYLNTENECFEKHILRFDLWGTLRSKFRNLLSK